VSWHDVGAAEELERTGRVVARVGGREVGVILVDGQPRGIRNRCPHHGGPLCHGRITGARFADAPYEHRWERDARVLVCPWHGWEFDLESGTALFDPSVKLRTFDARVEDGEIVLYRRVTR
jgi:nitrite reductase/ring-hydroxylating ferredoxin subunit